jgi:hypothetical protein
MIELFRMCTFDSQVRWYPNESAMHWFASGSACGLVTLLDNKEDIDRIYSRVLADSLYEPRGEGDAVSIDDEIDPMVEDDGDDLDLDP